MIYPEQDLLSRYAARSQTFALEPTGTIWEINEAELTFYKLVVFPTNFRIRQFHPAICVTPNHVNIDERMYDKYSHDLTRWLNETLLAFVHGDETPEAKQREEQQRHNFRQLVRDDALPCIDRFILLYFNLLNWCQCMLRIVHSEFSQSFRTMACIEHGALRGALEEEHVAFFPNRVDIKVGRDGSIDSHRIDASQAIRVLGSVLLWALDECCSAISARAMSRKRKHDHEVTIKKVSSWLPTTLLDILLASIHVDRSPDVRIQASRSISHLLDMTKADLLVADHDPDLTMWSKTCCADAMALLLMERQSLPLSSLRSFPFHFLISLPNTLVQFYILRGVCRQRNVLDELLMTKATLQTLISSVLSHSATRDQTTARTFRYAASLVEHVIQKQPQQSLAWAIEMGLIQDFTMNLERIKVCDRSRLFRKT